MNSVRDGGRSESSPVSVPKRETNPGALAGAGDQSASSPSRAISREKFTPHGRTAPTAPFTS